jgi:hypothetical protein
MRRIDIDRDVARTGIGCPVAMRRTIGIARDLAIGLGDQPRVAFSIRSDAPSHFRFAGRLDLEAHPAVADEWSIDRRAGGGIALWVGRANGAGHKSAAVPLALTISIEPLPPSTS